MSGDAAATPRGKWLSPSTFFSHQVQDGAHAGLIGKELTAQFIRIFSSRVSHFVEKTLDRKARVRVAAEGHQRTGTPDFGMCKSTRRLGIPLRMVASTSTEVLLT